MNQQKRREYWQVFDNFRKSREKTYAPKIYKALNGQKREFIEQYKQGNRNTFLLDSTPLKGIIEELYIDAGVTFGHKVLVSIKRQKETKARMPIGFNERMQQLIEQYYGNDFWDFGNSMSETTSSLLQKVLAQAQSDGLGFDDIIKLLEGTELSKSRARLIARTETVTAANSGADLSARESGIQVEKIWIATMDNRTRHDHSMVSQKPISLDDAFQVGVYQMAYPGIRKQPSGVAVGPEEICNCRCVESFVPIRDASGRVLTN